MDFHDSYTVDALRKTADGYLVFDARVARTGVQVYSGVEVGKPDLKEVRVYRPDAEVFAVDTLRSFAHRPITVGHPANPVTADNWRQHAVGQTGGEVVRDGNTVRVPMVLMDAAAIATVETGAMRELSQGYTCDLKWESGKTPTGEAYDAIQTNIRGNHTAIVPAARGGKELRIGDQKEKPLKTIMFDGISIEVTDQAEQAITKLQKALTDAQASLGTSTAALAVANTSIQTKDGEIVALKAQLVDAASPSKLDAAVAARVAVLDAAAKIIGKAVDGTGKTVDAIRREVVAAKLGDAVAATLTSDAAISGAFETLVATSGGAPAGKPANGLAVAVGDAKQVATDQAAAEAARVARDNALNAAWKTPTGQTAAV